MTSSYLLCSITSPPSWSSASWSFQAYFVCLAINWCNAHTLMGIFRVIGSVSNSDAFAAAYKCPTGSKMNPVKKCKIWWEQHELRLNTAMEVQDGGPGWRSRKAIVYGKHLVARTWEAVSTHRNDESFKHLPVSICWFRNGVQWQHNQNYILLNCN